MSPSLPRRVLLRRVLLRGLSIAGAAGLAACAAPVLLESELRALALPDQFELADTPYFPQQVHECGPAALAMVLGAAGLPASPEALAAEVFLPARQGSLQLEMLAGARRRGALAVPLEPTLQALLREVRAGHPVVVLQNLSLPVAPVWHYAVVIGYDLPGQNIVLRSGGERRLAMQAAVFERTWARSGRWAMVALPAGELPVSASEQTVAQALVAYERSAAPGDAAKSYERAVRRWPGNLTLTMGLGNTRHAAGDLPGAVEAFREAATRHEHAAAYNNLAQTFAQAGRIPEAIEAAARAVALGGPFVQTARQTLEAIRAMPQRPTP